MNNSFLEVYGELKRHGLLLESDKFLPSVAGIVSGEKMLTSWWSHKKGHKIFAVLNKLSEQDDVLLTKLISAKVTFIHKKWWLPFLTIASSNQPWQFKNLSEEAQALLKSVNRSGRVDTENFSKDLPSSRKIGEVVRELEKRILVCSYQKHTDQGFHAKVIETWDSWVQRKTFSSKKRISVQDAKLRLENLISDLNKTFGGKAKLPWN